MTDLARRSRPQYANQHFLGENTCPGSERANQQSDGECDAMTRNDVTTVCMVQCRHRLMRSLGVAWQTVEQDVVPSYEDWRLPRLSDWDVWF